MDNQQETNQCWVPQRLHAIPLKYKGEDIVQPLMKVNGLFQYKINKQSPGACIN